jgi:ABC-type multidrug transport system ATPase subunit
VLRVERLKVGPLPPLSFELPPGECLAVEGPSGSGKTRLLRAIADLDPAPGYVHLDAVERGEMNGPDWRRRVRYVATEPGWWADTPRAHVPAAARVRFERMIPSLGLPTGIADRPVAELSTGERQRLALARALCDDARVLLLDEPCASLDQQSCALVEELIRYQILSGRSVILVSHVEGQVGRLAHSRLQLARAPEQGRPAA